MSHAENTINVADIRTQAQDSVEAFAQKLIKELGENLQSITITASALTDDFKPGQSDINSALGLKQHDTAILDTLSSMAAFMKRKNIALPLLMTDDYINRSRDVFGIEFLNIQLNHSTVYGHDPFEQLSFEKSDVRLQCERELKAMLIRLRQGYIAAVGHKKIIRDLLISNVSGLIPVIRAMLWLKDHNRPKTATLVFEKAAPVFAIEPDTLKMVYNWRHRNIKPDKDQLKNAFTAVYEKADKLAAIVDKLEA